MSEVFLVLKDDDLNGILLQLYYNMNNIREVNLNMIVKNIGRMEFCLKF